MNNWLEELFGVKKPIIAMCHLQPLPGDPYYDKQGGMAKVLDCCRRDLHALQNGGVDAIMFSNEFSLPYLTKVEPVTIAAMAHVIGELKKEITVPYGVNCLWDPIASLDLAVRLTPNLFVKSFPAFMPLILAYGIQTLGKRYVTKWQSAHRTLKCYSTSSREAAKYLADRNIAEIAKSTEFNNRPDALCVSGLTAGSETDTQVLSVVKNSVKRTANSLQYGLQ